jgi:hypothetical protein
VRSHAVCHVLVLFCQVLVDTNTLAQHDITDDHTVHMVSRPADAPAAASTTAAAAGSGHAQAARASAATGMQRPGTRTLAEMMGGYDLPGIVSLVHMLVPATLAAAAASAALC